MKLKEGIVINELEGKYVAVDATSGADRFNGMIRMNKTAAFVAEQFREDREEKDVVAILMEKYDVSEADATKCVSDVVTNPRFANLFV